MQHQLMPLADFASTAMLRVLAQGMRELGLNPEPAARAAAGRGATVSLEEKRRLVGMAVAQGGFGCLPLLGRGLHRYVHEPTHRALASARDPRDLFTRWMRLERYIHSSHRIEVLNLTARDAHIVHAARPGHQQPLPAEDLVVLGVLIALLESVLGRPVAASIADVPVYPKPDHAALASLAQHHRTATWNVEWRPVAVASEARHVFCPPAPELTAPQTWPADAQRCFALLSSELMNPPTLPALAKAQGEAPRSLQRRLGRSGLSYTEILAQARCSSASWWLMATTTPVAEVGFVSGFADQPHFTRDFRKRVGMTPQRYRSDFCERA